MLVYIDESAIEDNLCPTMGFSKVGHRCYGEKEFRHKERVSMIAALNNGSIFAPIMFNGSCNSDIFMIYVKEFLVKELKRGQIALIDNINFHKNEDVVEVIRSVGCEVLFLPTYSPDLNQIEHYWFKIKHLVRKYKRNFENITDTVAYVLKNISTSFA